MEQGMERRARGPGTQGDVSSGAGCWGPPEGCAAGAGGLGTRVVWNLGARRPERMHPSRDWRRGFPALLRLPEMGGNPWASALRGGGRDGREGRRAWRGGRGRLGQLGASGGRLPVGTCLPGTRRGPHWDQGRRRGGLGGRFRHRRGGAPGATSEKGGSGAQEALESERRDRPSSFEEEEIQNSVGPGVRARVLGWEVLVPRARARAASV